MSTLWSRWAGVPDLLNGRWRRLRASLLDVEVDGEGEAEAATMQRSEDWAARTEGMGQ